MIGKIHSIQSLGTVDGPGIRFVVFLSGCPLRCSFCHNPDTWDMNLGKDTTPDQIVKKAENYREYFGNAGGITLSGGEPLLQPEFVKEIFSLCREKGINTCLDTAGFALTSEVKNALKYCDRVLLDVKFTTEEDYIAHAKGTLNSVLEFLKYLNKEKIKTTVRHVVIPKINYTEQNFDALFELIKPYSCVDHFELLPFKKLCAEKYARLNIPFPFKDIPEPNATEIKKIETALNLKLCSR